MAFEVRPTCRDKNVVTYRSVARLLREVQTTYFFMCAKGFLGKSHYREHSRSGFGPGGRCVVMFTCVTVSEIGVCGGHSQYGGPFTTAEDTAMNTEYQIPGL